MRTKAGWLSGAIVMVALGLAFAGAPMAQTTSTTDVRNFEVISVDGNQLIVRDEKGTQEITVPDDFRFTVDGKKMTVSELKAGMKGTAAVTTTTTVKPVFVTEVREGEVLRASPISMTVRTADGARKFTQAELDTKGIRIYKDGNSVRLSDLKKGDKLSATVITHGAPYRPVGKRSAGGTRRARCCGASANPDGGGDSRTDASGSRHGAGRPHSAESGTSRRTILRTRADVVGGDRRDNCVGGVLRAATQTAVIRWDRLDVQSVARGADRRRGTLVAGACLELDNAELELFRGRTGGVYPEILHQGVALQDVGGRDRHGHDAGGHSGEVRLHGT